MSSAASLRSFALLAGLRFAVSARAQPRAARFKGNVIETAILKDFPSDSRPGDGCAWYLRISCLRY